MHRTAVVLGAEMQWIASTLCKVFFIHGARFLRLPFVYLISKSKKITPLFSIDCDLKMQEMAS